MLQLTSFKHAPCPVCAGVVAGRSDKRYCSIKCKNEHHRNARIQIKSSYQEVQRKTMRNITVLEGILGPVHSCMAIHKDALFKRGFDVSVCSSVTRVKDDVFHELGRYSYFIKKSGIIYVRRNQELSVFMPSFFERWEIDFPNGLSVNGKGIEINESDESTFDRWNETS